MHTPPARPSVSPFSETESVVLVVLVVVRRAQQRRVVGGQLLRAR